MAIVLVDHRSDELVNPTIEQLKRALQSMDSNKIRHHGISLIDDEINWRLEVYPSGLVVWENFSDLDSIPVRHMDNVTRERMLQLWLQLDSGKIDSIEANPWQAGYGFLYPPNVEDDSKPGRIRINGRPVSAFVKSTRCPYCQNHEIYSYRYDAHCCVCCNVWLEDEITDTDVTMYRGRPEKPLPIERWER